MRFTPRYVYGKLEGELIKIRKNISEICPKEISFATIVSKTNL